MDVEDNSKDECVLQAEASRCNENREDDATISDLPGLEEKLNLAIVEQEKLMAIAQRAQADLENYKRRAMQERLELSRKAKTDVLLKVILVLDDLSRALALIPNEAVSPGWLEGLTLVVRSVSGILENEGVRNIEALGNKFDPHEFEAIQYEETNKIEDGQVISVIREGYKYDDIVIRAAQVVVAKTPEQNENSEVSGEETG